MNSPLSLYLNNDKQIKIWADYFIFLRSKARLSGFATEDQIESAKLADQNFTLLFRKLTELNPISEINKLTLLISDQEENDILCFLIKNNKNKTITGQEPIIAFEELTKTTNLLESKSPDKQFVVHFSGNEQNITDCSFLTQDKIIATSRVLFLGIVSNVSNNPRIIEFRWNLSISRDIRKRIVRDITYIISDSQELEDDTFRADYHKWLTFLGYLIYLYQIEYLDSFDPVHYSWIFIHKNLTIN